MRKIRTLILSAAAVIVAGCFSSCAGMAGTSVSFDEDGNVVVTPPPRPIVIPLEGGK